MNKEKDIEILTKVKEEYLKKDPYEKKDLIIPEGVEYIPTEMFKNVEVYGTIYIPKSVKEIGTSAFEMNPYGYETETHIVFKEPSSLKKIGLSAFSVEYTRKGSLHQTVGDLKLPDGLEEIGPFAFSNNQISSLYIPGTVKIIDEHAFVNCNELREVTFNEGLEYIEHGAFEDCYKLRKINLPRTIKKVDCEGFTFNNLKEIRYPSTLAWKNTGFTFDDDKKDKTFIIYDNGKINDRILPNNYKLIILEGNVKLGDQDTIEDPLKVIRKLPLEDNIISNLKLNINLIKDLFYKNKFDNNKYDKKKIYKI